MGSIEVPRERVAEYERANWMRMVSESVQTTAQLQAANEALTEQVRSGEAKLNEVLADLADVRAQLEAAQNQPDGGAGEPEEDDENPPTSG